MIKVICVCGARPNFIKIAPLMAAFEAGDDFETLLADREKAQKSDVSVGWAFS